MLCCIKALKGEVSKVIYILKTLFNSTVNWATRYSNINFNCPRFNRVTEDGRTYAVTTSQFWNNLNLELRKSISLEAFQVNNNYRNILFKEQQQLHHFITG